MTRTRSAILEHKGLYRHIKGEVPTGEHTVPLGEAAVAREGAEMTVITYGSGVHLALQVADELGEEIEVLDLRTLCPLDREAILASARRRARFWSSTRRPALAGSVRR